MKTLVIVRHAKSSWEFDVGDKERPLKKRGITDANLVSNQFITSKFNPDLICSSPANRALSTCKIFLKNLKIDEHILEISDDLYDFGGQNVMSFVRKLNNKVENVILFGHNHAFTAIANTFGDQYIDNLPTSGLVKMRFDIESWKDIVKGQTELVIFPRHLKH